MPAYEMRMINGKIIRTLITNQPTLPGPFLPPPPECPVRHGSHNWITISSYSTVRYWPAIAYLPWCSFCGVSKPT